MLAPSSGSTSSEAPIAPGEHTLNDLPIPLLQKGLVASATCTTIEAYGIRRLLRFEVNKTPNDILKEAQQEAADDGVRLVVQIEAVGDQLFELNLRGTVPAVAIARVPTPVVSAPRRHPLAGMRVPAFLHDEACNRHGAFWSALSSTTTLSS